MGGGEAWPWGGEVGGAIGDLGRETTSPRDGYGPGRGEDGEEEGGDDGEEEGEVEDGE